MRIAGLRESPLTLVAPLAMVVLLDRIESMNAAKLVQF
jgi:hypothetical protein